MGRYYIDTVNFADKRTSVDSLKKNVSKLNLKYEKNIL